jgi:crotonobetainyl-CoA:carnitine CoA-transferase CaiB-like acyl-CoA transferase
MTKPLDGIRVLDLSRLYPGPYCSMILADFGADVLCIEDRRYASEPSMPSVMRNKRHISLDLGSAGGREVFLRLVRDADVLLEGFRPGAMQRLGVGYETLRKENPRLVYCSVTGFGQTGPYRDMVGHDVNYLALGGVLGTLATGPDALPAIPGTQIADVAAGGMNAAIGILLALLARDRTGEGQYIDVSMTDGILAMNGYTAFFFLALGESLEPGRSMLTGQYPWYRVYRCADGRLLSIGAVEERFWKRLCEHFGVPEWVPLQYDTERAPEMHAFFEGRFAEKSRDAWFEELRSLDVCVAPVLDPREAFTSEQVKARDLVVEVEKDGQRQKLLGIPLKLSATPGSIESPPPGFGEHTDQVLSSLGYDAEAIERLRRSGDVS